MSQLTAERPSVPTRTAPPVSHRTVTVLVRDQRVTVECPSWCTARHTARLAALEDLVHESAPISVPVPTMDGTVPTLVAYRSQWPFGRTEADRRPYLSVATVNGGDCADIQDAAQVDALASVVEAYLADLRAYGRWLATA